MSLSDRISSALRVGVAALVAYALTYVAKRLHIVLDSRDNALVQAFVLAAVAAVYHQAASWLQRQWPVWSQKVPALKALSWLVSLLLGTARQPVAMGRPAVGSSSDSAAALRSVSGR